MTAAAFLLLLLIGAPIGDGDHWIHIHGENWRARSKEALCSGEAVTVTAIDGLILEVSHDEPPQTRR